MPIRLAPLSVKAPAAGSRTSRNGHGHRNGHRYGQWHRYGVRAGDERSVESRGERSRGEQSVESRGEQSVEAGAESTEAWIDEPSVKAGTGSSEVGIGERPIRAGAGPANVGTSQVAKSVGGVLRAKLARHPGDTKQGQHTDADVQIPSEHGQAPFKAGEGVHRNRVNIISATLRFRNGANVNRNTR
jgi:hypothetical protein